MDTAGGANSQSNQRRVIDRVLGKAQNENTSASNILKTFHNFDDWAQNNLNKAKLSRKHGSSGSMNVFDTNFNASQLASRRLERTLFIKMHKNED